MKTFIDETKKQEHLNDIDALWLQNENNIVEIQAVNKKQKETDEDIIQIWSCQSKLQEVDTKLEKDSSVLKEELESLRQELAKEKEVHLSDVIKQRKQIYVSYGIAGTAVLLSALILILYVVGVL